MSSDCIASRMYLWIRPRHAFQLLEPSTGLWWVLDISFHNSKPSHLLRKNRDVCTQDMSRALVISCACHKTAQDTLSDVELLCTSACLKPSPLAVCLTHKKPHRVHTYQIYQAIESHLQFHQIRNPGEKQQGGHSRTWPHLYKSTPVSGLLSWYFLYVLCSFRHSYILHANNGISVSVENSIQSSKKRIHADSVEDVWASAHFHSSGSQCFLWMSRNLRDL